MEMEKTRAYDISPPAYDDETVPAGATASPQPVLFTFSDHKEKTVSRPHVMKMTGRQTVTIAIRYCTLFYIVISVN